MLELGKNNLFAGSYYPISEIISFYELVGRNQIFFYKEESNFHHSIKVKKIKYKKLSDLSDLIFKNLFNIDLIIINDDSLISLYEIRKITDIPIIVIKDKKPQPLPTVTFDKIYSFSVLETDMSYISSEKNRKVTDEINKWTSSVYELKKKWIREKKIDDIFNTD